MANKIGGFFKNAFNKIEEKIDKIDGIGAGNKK